MRKRRCLVCDTIRPRGQARICDISRKGFTNEASLHYSCPVSACSICYIHILLQVITHIVSKALPVTLTYVP